MATNQASINYTNQQIDGFLIEDAVEHRAEATLYRAVQISVKRFVSFKVNPLPPEEAEKSIFLEKFNDQVVEILSLEHINLLPIYESGRIGTEAIYIVSRMLPGTLGALLRAGALTPRMALSLARQLGSALAFLHGQGFIHGSVSPRVIYIGLENHLYLNDLELARIVNNATSISVLQQLLGSLHYAPPEQIQLQVLDERSDIYSFGATLYNMVTGELPFGVTQSVDELMDLKLRNRLRSPHTFNPKIAPKLEAIILQALRADPDERFQTVQAMLDALHTVDASPTQELENVARNSLTYLSTQVRGLVQRIRA